MKADNFFYKTTARSNNSLQDVAGLNNTLSKPCTYHLSENYVVENNGCEHRVNMQYLIFELGSQVAPLKRRGWPAKIFTYLKTRIS